MDTQQEHKKPRKVGLFRVFMADSPSVPLTSSSSTNQTPLRRSRRNRRNRINRGQRVIQFESKTSYKFKKLTCGLLIFGKRQRNFLTAEEQAAVKEAKRLKKVEISERKVKSTLLRHKIANLWDHGMFMDDWRFGPHNAKKIIEYLQSTDDKYAKYNAAKSFVFRTIKKHKDAQRAGNLQKDPMRDRRGENRRSTKRKDAAIIALCDELLDLRKATAPKVQRELQNRGITISVSTVKRIANDLNYLWTKPWHTDVLTDAQKKKRKIFCANLLRLSEEELLNHIAQWLFTDEKWWDIVGPLSAEYKKADSKTEAKVQNQVTYLHNFCILCVHFCLFCVLNIALFFSAF